MTVAAASISPSVRGPTSRPRTAAELPDLLHGLGDIPAGRVLLDPPPGTASEIDVVRLVDGDHKVLCELVDGTLVEKAVGYRESLLALAIGSVLRAFVIPRNLGIVLGADAMMQMRGGNIRLPDVCFISWNDIPGGKLPPDPVGRFPVTLAVEVLSASNPKREMERKRKDYFVSGTRLVWEFDPTARTVAVFSSPDDPQLLDQTKILDGRDLLPGLAINLAEVFAELDRTGA